jgi:hypothetical protein
MFFRCHCTGPKSSWNHALLAHIYAKVAICKSCERSSRRHSQNRLSPGNPRFLSSIVPALVARKVTVWGWSPAEISSSPERFPYVLFVSRATIKYPLKDGFQANFIDQLSLHFRSQTTISTSPTRLFSSGNHSFTIQSDSSMRFRESLWSALRVPKSYQSASHPLADCRDISLLQGITAATSSP